MSPSLKPTHNLGHYTMAVSEYDKNGNIRNLERMGAINDSGKMGMMDQLVYSYAGNQLLGIAEGASNSKGFTSKTSVATQYDYDVNGNMVQDLNKGISSINYNHLNLPKSITIDGSNINYQYDASGVKLKKTVNSMTTEYTGATVYKNDVLEFIHMPEGYIEPTDNGYRYVYRLTDHLGNTRVSFFKNTVTKEVDVLDTNDYYPFGLEHQKADNTASSSNLGQNFKYNRKEVQASLGWYDYGARNYNPELGRWMNMDPLADKMRNNSPYNYAFNNPILFIDPDGMFPIVIHVRSFAPYKSFGASGWHGDNRGFSFNPSASSRLTQRTHYETNTGEYSHRKSGNMSYSNYGAIAYSEAYLNDEGSGNGSIKSHLYGNNDAFLPGHDGGPTWDIDLHTNIDVEVSDLDGGNQLLSITGSVNGDKFPNAEAYVTDSEGNSVWLGGFTNESGPDVGPFFTLAGDKNKSMIKINVGIITDKNGVFTGVKVGDKTISIEQWNKDSSGPMSLDEFKEKNKELYNSLFGNN